MVFAAGLGTRMRGAAGGLPKPLHMIGDSPLLGHMLARLEAAGIRHIVVNVHYKADMMIDYLRTRKNKAHISISDEGDARLETGGGVRKALPFLGDAPFFTCNADIMWQGGADDLSALAEGFNADTMAARLMLSPKTNIIGYDGVGDFDMNEHMQLSRQNNHTMHYIYSGVQIMQPALLDGITETVFSLRRCFDHAAAQGKLYGYVMQGRWMHVGTPQGLAQARAAYQPEK